MNKALSSLVFKEIAIEGYERVVEVREEVSGLHAIIAIHNTKLGPALGGIRAYPYKTFDEALRDVLRLAEGMTYKAAVSQTGTGGGKSVIIYDSTLPKSDDLLFAFAEAVNSFQGQYICAEDVGMPISDVEVIGQKTPYAVGLPQTSGDPSYYTTFGGFRGIQSVCKKIWGTDSPKGRTIAIQGLGSVGMKLAAQLFWHGAKLIVADLNPVRVKMAVKYFGATAVSTQDILTVPCDIFSPCALGGVLNAQTIPLLRCKAVAGLANNQLLSPQDGDLLHEKNILYAPDYVINSGGLLNVCTEIDEGGYHPVKARDRVDKIYDLLLDIFHEADAKRLSPARIAFERAERNLQNV